MPNMNGTLVTDSLTVSACVQAEVRKLCGEIGDDAKTQLPQSEGDGRPQERVLFPNPQPGELVSANVATLQDQTIERLVTASGNV